MKLSRRGLLLAGAAGVTGLAARRPGPDLAALARQTGVPALTGMVVTATAAPYYDAFGLRRINVSDPVTLNDLWHIGSNTEAITAALYGRLAEAGLAAWGAPIPSLFKDLTVDPAWAGLTIEDLFSHRAGVRDALIVTLEWLRRVQSDKRPVQLQRTELAQTLLSAPPKGSPGQFESSALGYILAGAAIERAARTDWESAVSNRLFLPLGMSSAGFGAPKGSEPWGHVPGLDGKLTAIDPAAPDSDAPVLFGPAGRVHLSLHDYAAFVRLFLTDGGGLLRPETLARFATPRRGGDSGYGLGWSVAGERAWAKGPVLSHEGSNGFWYASITLAPAVGLAVLTACNAGAASVGGAAVRRLSLELIQRYAAA